MIQQTDYSKLRPYGNRVLVRRYDLPDQVKSGLYLLGRDYPTMGEVLAIGNGQRTKRPVPLRGFDAIWAYRRPIRDISIGDIVQWVISPSFDLCDLGNNLLLLHYNDLNFIMR